MMYGTMSRGEEIRELAVQEIIDRQEDFKDFLMEDETMDNVVASLSTNSEWADNMAIQATAEALSITIEIVNSNQQRYGTRTIRPRTQTSNRHIIIGHIEQFHFVATAPDFQVSWTQWGGFASGWQMRNTCSVDGSLFWLILTLFFSPKFHSFVENNEIQDVLSIYRKYVHDRDAETAKLEWFKDVADNNIYRNHKVIDFHGSEGKNFFEPLSKTSLAGFSFIKKCSKSCFIQKQYKKMLRVKKDKRSLSLRIKAAFEKEEAPFI